MRFEWGTKRTLRVGPALEARARIWLVRAQKGCPDDLEDAYDTALERIVHSNCPCCSPNFASAGQSEPPEEQPFILGSGEGSREGSGEGSEEAAVEGSGEGSGEGSRGGSGVGFGLGCVEGIAVGSREGYGEGSAERSAGGGRGGIEVGCLGGGSEGAVEGPVVIPPTPPAPRAQQRSCAACGISGEFKIPIRNPTSLPCKP